MKIDQGKSDYRGPQWRFSGLDVLSYRPVRTLSMSRCGEGKDYLGYLQAYSSGNYTFTLKGSRDRHDGLHALLGY